VILLALLIISSYLIGSIPCAVLICEMLGMPDPRSAGSKNAGATNVRRTSGNKVGTIVLFADIMKGLIPTLIAIFLDLTLFEVSLVGLVAILGHIYPVFFGFKGGGKGVATYIGMLLALLAFPHQTIIVAVIFIITWLFVVKVLKKSSISALVATPISTISYYLLVEDLYSQVVMLIICVLMFYSHRENIKRLIAKKEM